MTPVFLDFETYWDSDYTLSKMSQIEYVMDDRFEAISCGIKVGGGETVVYVGDEIGPALAAIDWEDSIAVAHNMAFDGLILAWRYGYTPALWACTLCMARPLHGKDVGGSLKYLSEYYGYQPKGVLQTKGRRLADLLPAEIAALREYNVTDVDICARLFKVFLPVTSLGELRLIDRTLRMALEPRLEADTVLLEHGLKAEQARKAKALERLSARLHMTPELLRKELASAQKFSALLESWGVEVPTKPSPATGKPIPALAKTDLGMQELLEHEDELVATAAALRLDVKSTILETRLETMIRLASVSDGKMPITLRYYGATNTGRWSGDTWNPQNLPRVNPAKFQLTDVLRLSLKAPEGHQIVVADLAGIELRVNMFLWQVPYAMELFRADPDKADLYKAFAATLYRVPVDQVDKTMRQMGKLCVAEGTLVLTKRGEVPIEQVTSSDAVWDGVEWVDTLGPVYNGEQEVITHDNITATPDHVVWVEDGRALSLEEAAAQSLRLARTGTGGAPVGFVGADRHSVYPARRLPLRESALHRLRDGAHDELRQPESREVYELSVLCGKMRGTGVVDSAHGSSEATLHQPEGQSVLSLRGEGDTVLFPERSRSSGVGDGELGAASGPGDRSRGQQRELRARKHSLRFSEGEHQQPEQLDNTAVPQVSDAVPGGTVRGHYAAQHAKPRHDLRGDRVPLGDTVVQTKRRVWDLLDCGPRHRFTANGRLISNCHLGLGYGASANTFRRVAKTMGGVEVPQTEAENIVNVWREAHQEVVQGWWKCTGALHAMYSGREMTIDPWGLCRTGKDHIILPRGILRYTDLRQENDSTGKPNWVYGKGRYKTKIYSSKLDENLVQALSRYVLSDIMLAYADTELGQRYPIVHCVHDELVVVAADNDAQAVLDLLLTLMKTPPAWWPELVTSAEGSFAQRYGEAK